MLEYRTDAFNWEKDGYKLKEPRKGKYVSNPLAMLYLILTAIFMQTIYFGRHCERIATAAHCLLQCTLRGKQTFTAGSFGSVVKLA